MTYQSGASFQVTREISLYALKSGGLQPNFTGNRDTNGKPLPATLAKSREAASSSILRRQGHGHDPAPSRSGAPIRPSSLVGADFNKAAGSIRPRTSSIR